MHEGLLQHRFPGRRVLPRRPSQRRDGQTKSQMTSQVPSRIVLWISPIPWEPYRVQTRFIAVPRWFAEVMANRLQPLGSPGTSRNRPRHVYLCQAAREYPARIADTLQKTHLDKPFHPADQASENESCTARMITVLNTEGLPWLHVSTEPANIAMRDATHDVSESAETEMEHASLRFSASSTVPASLRPGRFHCSNESTGVPELGEAVLVGLRKKERLLTRMIHRSVKTEIEKQAPLIIQTLNCGAGNEDEVTCDGTMTLEPTINPTSLSISMVFSKSCNVSDVLLSVS